RIRPEVVAHDGRVLAVEHADRLLDLQAGHMKPGDRKGITPEAREILVAGRMDDAGVLVRGEFKPLPVNDEGLLQFRKEYCPTGGRRHGGDQQSVVTACVEAGEGGAGEAAQAIRLQPLARGRDVKVSVNANFVQL